MANIKMIFEKFLTDQKERLQKATYNKYEQVIELFRHCIDGYAYNNLEKAERDLYEKSCDEEDKDFSEYFGVEKIDNPIMNEFLTYFMVRKVAAGKGLMKSTGTVMLALIKWLKDNSHIDNEKFMLLSETVKEVKDDLPKVIELADLLVEETDKNSLLEFEEYEEGQYIIERIDTDGLWVLNYMESDTELGPVLVPEKISSLAKEGWSVYLELGEKAGNWYIIGSGCVYPD